MVANHPFDGLEGLVLLALLRHVRPDVRLMANYLLRSVPEIRSAMFFGVPFGSIDAPARNRSSLRAAIRWLKQGGALGVFPAGEVAYLNMCRRRVVDPLWNNFVARLIKRGQASVVPIYFDGRNSNLFQLVGLVHPRLRTVMLPREILRKRDSRIHLCLGRPIPYAWLDGASNCEHTMAYLRMRTRNVLF